MEFTDIVSNVKIYDLEESIIASGYPMRTKAGMREVEDKDINKKVLELSKTKSLTELHNIYKMTAKTLPTKPLIKIHKDSVAEQEKVTKYHVFRQCILTLGLRRTNSWSIIKL